LGYRLPESLVKVIKLRKAEVFMNLKNMLTITQWKGLDPEFLAISPVNQQRAAPQVKTILFGLKIGL
jgi:hypothetical protein